jgi:hypothetical protein
MDPQIMYVILDVKKRENPRLSPGFISLPVALVGRVPFHHGGTLAFFGIEFDNIKNLMKIQEIMLFTC